MWPEAVGCREAVGRGEEMLVVLYRVGKSRGRLLPHVHARRWPLADVDEGARGGAQARPMAQPSPGGPGWGALALTLLLRHTHLCLESAGPAGSTADVLGAQGRHQPRVGSRPPVWPGSPS